MLLKGLVACIPRSAWVMLLVVIAATWFVVLDNIENNKKDTLNDAQVATQLKAQIYAEHERATIKRINELLLDLRAHWIFAPHSFAQTIEKRHEHIDDIAFQVAIINANGLLEFSTLTPPGTRIDLSDREHFRVHRDSTTLADRLFISHPVKGRASGKWSIQFTRPILTENGFSGVIVISVSPERFSSFHNTLGLHPTGGASSIFRDSGEVLARYPKGEEFYGKKVAWPYSSADAPLAGHFQYVARLDGIERMFGYFKLPEYGLVFFAAEPMSELMAPHHSYRQMWLWAGSVFTIFAVCTIGFLGFGNYSRKIAHERLAEADRSRRILGAGIEQSNASIMVTDTKGNIVFTNSAFERITGYTADEAIGKNPRFLKSGLVPAETYQAMWTSLCSGQTWRGELQNRKKSGEIYWEALSISPVLDERGVATHFLAVQEQIDERKHLEKALRQSEAQIRAVLDASPVPLALNDASGNITYLSPSFTRTFGYTLADIPVLAEWWHRAYPDPAYRQQVIDEWQAHVEHAQLEDRPFVPVEARICCRDGSERHAVIDAAPLGGAFADMHVVMLNDVTEHRQAEQARKAAETKYSLLFDLLPIGISVSDPAGQIIDTNVAAEHILGLAREDHLKREITGDAWHILRPDGSPMAIDEFPSIVALKEQRLVSNVVMGVERPDKQVVWLDVSAAPVNLPGYGVVVVYADISARLELERSLAEFNRDFEAFLNQTTDFIYFKDANSRFRFCSQTLANITRHSHWRELIGKHDFEVFPPDTAQIYYEEELPVFREGKPLLNKIDPYYDADGHTGYVMTNKWPLFDPHGEVIGIFGISRDITKIKEAEAELAAAKEAAEAANIAKSRFLATMSHEIRTPMNGILGMAQMLLMPEVGHDERRDYARIIMNSGQTLLTLLNDILDLSKIEAGRIEMEVTPFQPDEMVREAVSLFAGSCQTKGLTISGTWNGSAGERFEADTHRIRQMLSNLVSNAIKFTEQGSVSIEARVISATTDSVDLEFAVVDTGVGVANDALQALFSPFFQGDSSISRKYGGTGLGLSIVRSLARIMGGDAGVDSHVGEGSRFWFRIRAKALPHEADILPALNKGRNSPQYCTFRGRVLVVEDNAIDQAVINALLKKLGITPVHTGDGQQGLDALQRSEAFELVLMDLKMPVMDGYEATKRIREWERAEGKQHTPIIALTADAFDEDRAQCQQVGMDDYLTKPLQVKELIAVLEKHLQKAEHIPDTKVDRPIDEERITAILKRLLSMLADSRLDAVDVFKELKAETTGTRLTEALSECEHLLMQLKFADTSAVLRDLANRENWEIDRP